jgi:predicted phosphodiesterase
MKKFEDMGINRVYVTGDVVDGINVFRGHREYLITDSIEGQTDIAAKSLSQHPKLEFWAISGNHDFSFTKQNGARPLAILEKKIHNFRNLGDLRADIIEDGIKTRLLHGASGRITYATSYPSQVYLRDLFTGFEREDMSSIPHMLLLGHYHRVYQGQDHGIYILQPGSFQDPDNEYCLRRGLTGPNGAYKVSIVYKSGDIYNFSTEYINPRLHEKGSYLSKLTPSW